MRYLNNLSKLASDSINNISSVLTWCTDNPGLSISLFLCYCALPAMAAGQQVYIVFNCGLFGFYKNNVLIGVSENQLFGIEDYTKCFKPWQKDQPESAFCYVGPASLFDTKERTEGDLLIALRNTPASEENCAKFLSFSPHSEL